MNYESWRATFQSSEQAARAAFKEWQAARAQGEKTFWGPKPTKPGRYAVRGFDDANTEALVCIAVDRGDLVCNLHDCNSEDVSHYSNLLSELSEDFEWLELLPHSPSGANQGGVPEGWKLVPITPSDEMCTAAVRAEIKSNTECGEPAQFSDIWDSMIEAAPQPPAQEGE